MASLIQYLAPNLSKADSEPHLSDFNVTAWIAIVVLILRVVTEKIFLPPLRRHLKAAREGGEKAAEPVLDNLWIATFAGSLCIYAWWVTVEHNGGCTPWSTKACFENWPNHHANLPQRWYMIGMFGYYLYEMIGTAVHVGTKLKGDMVAHHIVTMALIFIAYSINLNRMCCMWTALFDISNPLLHLAKTLNIVKISALETVKWGLFNLFALSFLVCRVLAGPYSILWPAFTEAPKVMPLSYTLICQALMLFIYTLQLIWFYKIVKIAVGGPSSAKED